MSTLDHNEPDDKKILGSHGPKEIDASAGYEQTDVKVTGIVVFLTALAIFVAVSGVLSYGIGKVINARMNKEDGPNSKWTKTADVRQLGNLPSSPELQNKVAEITKSFPTPRLQTDDGNQDVADLHAREDLLLDNYSWVDRSQGKVRIPDRARNGVDCSKGTSGCAQRAACSVNGGRSEAGDCSAPDQRICTHRL